MQTFGEFEKELIATGEIIRRELASTLRTALMHLESELTTDYIVAKFLINETSPLLSKEILRFRDSLRKRIKMSDFPSEKVGEGMAQVIDHVCHKVFKRYLSEMAERLQERIKLLVVLMRYQNASGISGTKNDIQSE